MQSWRDYLGHSYLMQKCIVLEYAQQINCNKNKMRVKRVELTFMTWFYNILRIIIHLNHILKWEVLTNQVNWLLSYFVFHRIYIIYIVSAIFTLQIIKYDLCSIYTFSQSILIFLYKISARIPNFNSMYYTHCVTLLKLRKLE